MKTPPPTAPVPIDPDAPASEDELRAAEELRDALADDSLVHGDAALARALHLAHSPQPLDPTDNEALVARALQGAAAVKPSNISRLPWRGRWAAAGVGVLAAAAAVLVFQQARPMSQASLEPAPAPILTRSTQPLFREPFGSGGRASARIDRIASARASDLRENMFVRWDVK